MGRKISSRQWRVILIEHPKDSGKATAYAKDVVGGIKKSFEKAKMGKVKSGGMGIGDSGKPKLVVTDRGTDGLLKDFMDGRGAVGMKANIFRDDDKEEYLDMIKQGVDVDFN